MSICQYCRNEEEKTHFECRKEAGRRSYNHDVCSCCGNNHDNGDDHTKCMSWVNFPGR